MLDALIGLGILVGVLIFVALVLPSAMGRLPPWRDDD